MKHGDRFSDQHEQHAEVPHELSVVAGPASGTLIGDDGGIDLAGAVARIVGIEVSGERRIIGGPVLHSVILQTECHERAMRKRQAPSVRGRSLETEREGPVTSRTPSARARSEEHTSALQSLMRNSYAVFCLKTKN